MMLLNVQFNTSLDFEIKISRSLGLCTGILSRLICLMNCANQEDKEFSSLKNGFLTFSFNRSH